MDTFIENGTYEDPSTKPISGNNIVKMVEGLSGMYNDLRFEITYKEELPSGIVVAEWLMKGQIQGQETPEIHKALRAAPYFGESARPVSRQKEI